MSKEIAIYVSKELCPSGRVKYSISSNRSSGDFTFSSGELPPQNGDGIQYHESFNGQMNALLHYGKVTAGKYELKVFYNTEYKTIGKCVANVESNKCISYCTKNIFNIVPMTETEILHFMKLFLDYNQKEL